jgi:hypothetical protein
MDIIDNSRGGFGYIAGSVRYIGEVLHIGETDQLFSLSPHFNPL